MSYRDDFRDVEREGYWSLPRIFVGLLVIMVLGFGLTFASDYYGLMSYKFFGPQFANAQREVFVNSNNYIQGKTGHLSQLRESYQMAVADGDNAHASILKSMILTEAATVDNSKLPADLSAFISSLKGGL